MLLDQINLNHLRIFESVFRARSMTIAASELHLTQSGISQHIKSLEDSLGIKLFDRINQKLVPTSMAQSLYEKCSNGFSEIERGLLEIKGNKDEIKGVVHIGMPIEFGNYVLIPMLSRFGKEHPGVQFIFNLDFASVMNDKLLSGELDFAFVDEFSLDRRIKVEKVYDELDELCIRADLLKGTDPENSKKFFESLDYIAYQEGEPMLRLWFKHHIKTRHINLKVRVTVMDVGAVARLIQNGMGAGVLPRHMVERLKIEGVDIHVFKGCGESLQNSISVAYLEERTQSLASGATLQWLKSEFQER